MTSAVDEKPAVRLYLIVPFDGDPAQTAAQVAAICAAADTACVRITTPTDGAPWAMAATLKPVCEAAEVALLATDDVDFAYAAKLDGVHMTAPSDFAAARDTLGEARIVGVACGTSRHAGLSAAERGADYVAFDPDLELLEWWQTMIEVPCVVEGATLEHAPDLGPWADFISVDLDADPAAVLAAAQAQRAV